MVKDSRFDDIRPYYEEEIPDAMHRIADSDVFPLLASFVYPSDTIENVRNRIRSFKTVREFQHDTMRRVNEQIIARSITDFSVSGLERLSPDKHYLFISNHRDIMLDASLLQYYFVVNGFDTTEITFGANLMMHPVVIDVGKCNKMFKVARPGGDIKEFYRNSMHLSERASEWVRGRCFSHMGSRNTRLCLQQWTLPGKCVLPVRRPWSTQFSVSFRRKGKMRF